MKKIAFIFPSPIVGGHELMAIKIIKKWQAEKEVTVDAYISESNKRISSILNAENITHKCHGVPHRRLQIIHAFINVKYRKSTLNFLNSIRDKYDDVIVVQGDIELGSVFLLMAKQAGIMIKSYIPYAHSFKKMGAKLSLLKDALSKVVYRSCSSYITISNCFRRDILRLNDNAHVDIIENFIGDEIFKHQKTKNNNEKDRKSILKVFIIGRVYFKQKGHDILLEAIKYIHKNISNNVELHVVGDGPDLTKLKNIVNDYNLSKYVYFHGWLENCWELIDNIDLIVIPSRFEGVPLVMLEALKLDIPIIASNRDGMSDYIHVSNLFDFSSNSKTVESLTKKIIFFLPGFNE